MSWLDIVTGLPGTALGVAEAAGKPVPVVGEVLSAEQALYHSGSAVYDGVTGDRDGAIGHGTQAAFNAVTAIPVLSESFGAAEAAYSIGATEAKVGMELAGEDPDRVPGGFGDILAQGAVGATRAIFGEDDSNWIAEGDTPTGTRRGEIQAGTKAATTSGVPTILRPDAVDDLGDDLGGVLADTFAENPDGPTSGVNSDHGLAGDYVYRQLAPIGEALGTREPSARPARKGTARKAAPDMVFTERDGEGDDMAFTQTEAGEPSKR